ncbi:G-box-binding factor 1 isoform X1 [Neltuma alba]|uniref:G-box-binding factor 1 isoform X1 n=1 Tax=Neltuma alba TaxID=207710 RepID=UPI0010A2F732|nr:G-box-binding factor 1-like isoform X1 [Prosopis alba]XP_028798482.1 G-box-binding factor 1-like isoform X1 [Prosopis alba]
MGTEESNTSTKPSKTMVVQDETENKPLQPLWYTSIQGYHYPMPAPTPIINSHAAAAGSYYYPHIWPNQTFCSPLKYDPLHDPSGLKDHPIVSGGSASTFSDKVQRTFSGENVDLTKACEGNLQPRSSVLKELRENGNESSISKNEQDRGTWSATNGSMGSSDEGHDTDNGFPSSREQQCNMMLANRDLTQNGARIENGNAIHVNKESASQQFAVNSSEPNLNSETNLNTSGTIHGLAKLEEDEIRKERKRQLNRESARRSRMRRQQECDELRKIMDDLVKKNSLLKDKLVSLSEDCLELNNENDYIEEEITKMYGIESIADLIAMRPGGVTR